MEILQAFTLGFIGMVWHDIRELRKELSNARERLSNLEGSRGTQRAS